MKDSEQQRKDAEDRLGNVKKELEQERKKPPEIEYKYSDKCYRCNKYEYDKAIAEIRENRIASMQDRKKAAEELAAAERIHAYHEEVITERVNEIVHEKTRYERMEEKFRLFWSGTDAIMFNFPLLYAIGITIMAIVRNDVVRKDFIAAAVAVGKAFADAFNGVKWLICFIAGFTKNIENGIAAKILWGVIVVLLTLLIIAVIVVVGFFGYVYISAAFEKYKAIFGKAFLGVCLADLGVVTFLGDLVKRVIPINLVLTYIFVLAVYIVARHTIPYIARRIKEGRE